MTTLSIWHWLVFGGFMLALFLVVRAICGVIVTILGRDER